MCELFGVSAASKVKVNNLLKEFFSHSVHHPHGWGMAFLYGNAASLEKEPIQAIKSRYLKERLRYKIEVKTMIAHIRLATMGQMDYENCHPFVKKDNSGRRWTLAHNGTMFRCPQLDPYFYKQEGRTDSERVLYYLIDRMNEKQDAAGHPLNAKQRFELLDEQVCALSEGNKLNFLLYDGEQMYVHTNYANSLNVCRVSDGLLFATTPLGREHWEPHPFTQLCAYKKGQRVFEGTVHHHEYKDNEEDQRYLFLDSAAL